MGGKMTFNGDMSKGKSMKGLFVAWLIKQFML
jgi:hypothetical protein